MAGYAAKAVGQAAGHLLQGPIGERCGAGGQEEMDQLPGVLHDAHLNAVGHSDSGGAQHGHGIIQQLLFEGRVSPGPLKDLAFFFLLHVLLHESSFRLEKHRGDAPYLNWVTPRRQRFRLRNGA